MYSPKSAMQNPQAEIMRLKEELYMLRRDMIRLMHEDAQRILLHSPDCESLADVLAWSEKAAKDLLALCHPQPAESMGGRPGDSPRASCPLCGGNSTAGDAAGYVFPEGVLRHLLGTYNAKQCAVLGAAVAQAISHLDMGN